MHEDVAEYRRLVIARNHALNSKEQNRLYDAVIDHFRKMIAKNTDWNLFSLYDDSDPGVQCAAATHTLELDEARAIAKLTELEHKQIPLVSTTAHYCIKEFKNGKLRFRDPLRK